MASSDFENGRKAAIAGLPIESNPYICGLTKLGSVKMSDTEKGWDWQDGFKSALPARVATKKEIDDAANLDVSRFRRKSNRYYNS